MGQKFTYITALILLLLSIYLFYPEAGNKHLQYDSFIKDDSVTLLKMPVNDLGKSELSASSFRVTENFRSPVSNPRIVKTPNEDILISQTIRVHPSNGTQSETPI